MEGLFELAGDIVEKAEFHDNQVVYKSIPGMYNQKIIDNKSVDVNDELDEVEIIGHEISIQNIKNY